MCSGSRVRRFGFISSISLLLLCSMTSAALAQGADRDLSAYTNYGVPFTVTITLDPPPDASVAALEDAPPAGWTTIVNISDSGVYDAQNHKVKWGPFVGGGQIPAFVTYDITPPLIPGDHCFSGEATYDDGIYPITGDECILIDIPTLSEWGLLAMSFLVMTAGTLLSRRTRALRAQPR
ncbi:MAG: IPTL-CTERM sorting domain-containing protein [Phycisphaerae bacterium]|jgi:hypothetical protein